MNRTARSALRAACRGAVGIFVIALVSVSLPSLAATVAVPVGQDAVALGADLAHDVRSVLGLPEGSDVSYLAASLKPQATIPHDNHSYSYKNSC